MTPQELFMELHEGLPRQAPGRDEDTLRALRMLSPWRPNPRVLDLGCGPGAQTLVLARETGGLVTAVDLHEPFLDELMRRAEAAGLAAQVHPLHASMDSLDVKSEVFDLVWAEGSAYILGISRALSLWRRWLRPGGGLAFSELTWLKPSPPEDLRAWLDREYPDMLDVPGNLARIQQEGYDLVGHFTLPESAWWEPYYEPLEARHEAMLEKYGQREDLRMTIEESILEIDMYRRYSAWYGYVFFVLRRPG